MSKSTVSVVAIVALLGLAGCAQTPGDAEVREALTNWAVDAYTVPGRKLTGAQIAQLKTELNAIKVIGCKPAESKNGFNCDWTGGDPTFRSARIVKSDSGWIIRPQ